MRKREKARNKEETERNRKKEKVRESEKEKVCVCERERERERESESNMMLFCCPPFNLIGDVDIVHMYNNLILRLFLKLRDGKFIKENKKVRKKERKNINQFYFQPLKIIFVICRFDQIEYI